MSSSKRVSQKLPDLFAPVKIIFEEAQEDIDDWKVTNKDLQTDIDELRKLVRSLTQSANDFNSECTKPIRKSKPKESEKIDQVSKINEINESNRSRSRESQRLSRTKQISQQNISSSQSHTVDNNNVSSINDEDNRKSKAELSSNSNKKDDSNSQVNNSEKVGSAEVSSEETNKPEGPVKSAPKPRTIERSSGNTSTGSGKLNLGMWEQHNRSSPGSQIQSRGNVKGVNVTSKEDKDLKKISVGSASRSSSFGSRQLRKFP